MDNRNNNNRQPDKRQNRRPDKPKPKRQERKSNEKHCQFCNGHLKARGAIASGHLRWKCRKCGRTVWVRPEAKKPEPVQIGGKGGVL